MYKTKFKSKPIHRKSLDKATSVSFPQKTKQAVPEGPLYPKCSYHCCWDVNPYASNGSSYGKDTTDFLRKQQSILNFSDAAVLNTVLHINASHKDGLQAILNHVTNHLAT